MTPKPYPTSSKASALRPVRKVAKGTSETARLFIHIAEDAIRRTQSMTLTRYVE